ncbi:MAG: hypothetical protein II844_05170 [Prevotella sp.]|nr:hypothetical protein [Prevotella sp.]MBR6191446.1 hypothetical protein [Prevotella sp.]
MKKIFLLFASVCALAACDPVHEDFSNGGHITADELKAMSTVTVEKVEQIGGQQTFTAAKGESVVLLENVDVTDCNAVVIYFAEKVDKNWEISYLPDGSFEKIPGGTSEYYCPFDDKAVNGKLNQIVLKRTEDTEDNSVKVKAIYKTYGTKVASGKGGEFGNVITCQTSAPVNAKWEISGKEFIGNYANSKVKVNWNDDGDFVTTDYVITLTALCPDGTKVTVDFPVKCDKISNPLVKHYIYGDPNRTDDEKAEDPQLPFKPAAWSGADMRFSSTEGSHLPTIPDDVYFGLKTLIFDVADATDNLNIIVLNGWWGGNYYTGVKWKDGLNELKITQEMADQCAKGGEGRDLMPQVRGGSMTLKAVYYEE